MVFKMNQIPFSDKACSVQLVLFLSCNLEVLGSLSPGWIFGIFFILYFFYPFYGYVPPLYIEKKSHYRKKSHFQASSPTPFKK